MKLLTAAAAFSLAVLFVAPALAADATTVATAAANTVTFGWGDDLVALLSFVTPFLTAILLGVVTLAARFLPASLQAYNTSQNRAAVEQLLEKAVDFGMNKVEGAAKGQTLKVDVGSAVLATAAQFAVDHGPSQLIAWAGGADSLMEKILARLNLEPGTDGSAVLASAVVPVTK